MKQKRKAVGSLAAIAGQFRINIVENGKVVGDSGWVKNQLTDDGVKDYLLTPLTGGAAKAVTHMGIGSGGAPAANATILPSELGLRVTVATSTLSSGRVAQFTAQFASSTFSTQNAKTISNLGLYGSLATTVSNLFAGQTFASSQWNTNQDVNATYQVKLLSTT